MKVWVLGLSISIFGCSSTDVSNIYKELDSSENGYEDKYRSAEAPFEIYSQSEVSNENAVAVALYRANELCGGKFSIKEIESG